MLTAQFPQGLNITGVVATKTEVLTNHNLHCTEPLHDVGHHKVLGTAHVEIWRILRDKHRIQPGNGHRIKAIVKGGNQLERFLGAVHRSGVRVKCQRDRLAVALARSLHACCDDSRMPLVHAIKVPDGDNRFLVARNFVQVPPDLHKTFFLRAAPSTARRGGISRGERLVGSSKAQVRSTLIIYRLTFAALLLAAASATATTATTPT